jgi:hypothetical protein
MQLGASPFTPCGKPAGLENLRAAAAFAATKAHEMDAATERLQSMTEEIGNSVDLLDACFCQLTAVVQKLVK